MTIEELKHIIKKEKNNINRTMEGLIAKLEQMEALAPEKRKKVTKKIKQQKQGQDCMLNFDSLVRSGQHKVLTISVYGFIGWEVRTTCF